MWILLDLNDSDIRIARPNRVTKKHTKRRKTTHPPASPVVWTRLVDRVDPMRRGDNIYRPAHHARCRARPFTHACARAVARVIRSRRVRETTRRLDRSHPFVRSVASIRSHRILSRIARVARDSRRPDRSPIRPLGPSRRARESSIEGWWIVGSLCARSLAVDVDALQRGASTGRVDFHSCIRSFARRGRGRGRRRRRRRRRARATRSIDARDVEASAERRGDRGGGFDES